MKWVIMILLVAAAAGGAAWYFNHSKVLAPQYTTVTVAPDDLTQTVTATGSLNPVVNVLVGCRFPASSVKSMSILIRS